MNSRRVGRMTKEIPWRRLRSWACLRCGKCCSKFKVTLRPYEYAKISELMPEAVVPDVKPFLRKIGGKCVFQNEYGLCDLQELGLKPFSCKVWPFLVYKKPKSINPGEAEFHYNDEKYYVYLNQHAFICTGVNMGMPEELPNIIWEVIEIYKNPWRKQKYSTSRLVHLQETINIGWARP
ncbi:MAG: YkgJ family cysteine cluster protein [Thermoproteota archaeon]